ncbi:MAG: hypothetical protein GY725_25790 [bacterium]|nr:hypothetical protein [bacterium]
MNSISARYAPHIAVMLAVVLIPVVIHDYVGWRRDDCANPGVLIPDSYAERQPEKRQSFMKSAFAADQWREGRVHGDRGETPLSYSIIRSWNAKRVYYRPAHRIAPARKPSGEHLKWVEHKGERIPIHVGDFGKRTLGGVRSLSVYALLYDSQPVANPYWTQLLAAPSMLIRGSQPMTLLIVSGHVPTAEYDRSEERGIHWILNSLDTYWAVCSP